MAPSQGKKNLNTDKRMVLETPNCSVRGIGWRGGGVTHWCRENIL